MMIILLLIIIITIIIIIIIIIIKMILILLIPFSVLNLIILHNYLLVYFRYSNPDIRDFKESKHLYDARDLLGYYEKRYATAAF